MRAAARSAGDLAAARVFGVCAASRRARHRPHFLLAAMDAMEAAPSALVSSHAADSRPKRPRAGRKAAGMLGAIEGDTASTAEARAVRHVLLYLGRPERREPLVDTLRAQAMELDVHFAAAPQTVVDAVMEW